MKLTKPTILLFIGTVGSGKGTQVALLNKLLGLTVITMGNMLRAEAQLDTVRGQRVKTLINHGNLVSAELWESIVRDYLPEYDLSHGAFLDGVIRSMDQVDPFERIRAEHNLPPLTIINIELPETKALERLKLRGRHDDTEEATRNRLEWSREQTAPVVEYYRGHGGVIDINGDQPIETVHREIVAKLKAAELLADA